MGIQLRVNTSVDGPAGTARRVFIEIDELDERFSFHATWEDERRVPIAHGHDVATTLHEALRVAHERVAQAVAAEAAQSSRVIETCRPVESSR